jgi:hypothetical protein
MDRKKRSTYKAIVVPAKPDHPAFVTALILAAGDKKRLQELDSRTILVRNNPIR